MQSKLFNFSSRISHVDNVNELSALLSCMAKTGKPVINASDSNPTNCGISPWQYVQMPNIGCSSYAPDARGLYSARLSLAMQYGGQADDYFLSASSSESYSWLFKLLCNPGDVVLVPKPGYPLFESLAELEAINIMSYHLDYRHEAGWYIDVDELKALSCNDKVKAIVIIHPNNPTGSYVSDNERKCIVELCASKKIALIADEVFFNYNIEASSSGLKSFAGESRCLTFVLGGLSKLLCLPQLKLGWMRVSGLDADEAAKRLEVIADTFLSVSSPVMQALPNLLGAVKPVTEFVKNRARNNITAARKIFALDSCDNYGKPFPSPYRVLTCSGGWTVLIEFPRYLSEEAMAMRLLEKYGIYVQPGYFFDMPKEGSFAISLILEEDKFYEVCINIKKCVDESMA